MGETNKLINYVDEHGLQTIAKGILSQVNTRITERIVTTLDENSDDNHIASAATVYKAIVNSKRMSVKFITGNIDELVPIENRDPSVLYFQRDDEEDKTWMIYIWDIDNTRWVCVGDTEIDLNKYWSKDENEELKKALGVDVLGTKITEVENDLTAVKAKIATMEGDNETIKTEIDTINGKLNDIDIELDLKVNKEDLGPIALATVKSILNSSYEETDPFKYEEVSTLVAAKEAIDSAVAAGQSEVAVRLINNVEMSASDTIEIPAGIKAVICINGDAVITADEEAFKVAAGGELTLNGSGTIVSKITNGKSVVNADAATVTIDGITIDCGDSSFAYAVYGENDATINIKSGVIKAATSAVTTNNLTGGATINITGGELYSSTCYAIYNAAQSDINITGGIVQGINARMGNINIGGNAQIISTILNETNYDKIGEYFATSGVLFLGDTITIIAGTYSDAKGIDVNINIKDNAVVDSEFRSAIGVYSVDTKAAANVNITVDNGKNVTTSDAEADAISVYDHEYITTGASEAKRTYKPVATSNIVINVDGSKIYPAV